jgi:hypothetical protein
MPHGRVSQQLSRSGEEIAPPPSTQSLPCINEDWEMDAFAEIEEVKIQQATNIVGTSIGATTGSSQNDEGVGAHKMLILYANMLSICIK